MSCHYKNNRTLIPYSRENRKEQTDAEKLLWHNLRARQLKGFKFRRQYPIHNFILDFYCVEKQVSIELDGSQHIQRSYYDEKRTKILHSLGIQTLRFWDTDVLQNIEGVLTVILAHLETPAVK